MITAIDTSVLLDVLADDPHHATRSAEALAQAVMDGAVIASPVVVAELRAAYDDDSELFSALNDLRVRPASLEPNDALLAGAMHAGYLRAGGSRNRVIADFLIGAHAVNHAARLLARDRGFYRKYFRGLTVWYPE